MTSLTSRTALFFYALILAPLGFINLSTIATERAEAKNPQKNAGLDNRKALQDQIDKTNSQTTQKDLYRTDYSNNFSYILPPGWQVTQNPMYPHDILVKQKSEGKGNIVLADQQAKGNLGKISSELVDELPKQCDDFKLVSNEMLKLPSGANCARLIHTGKLGESEICQVNYLMPYTRGRVLIVTGTVINGDKEGLDTVEKFTFSVTMKKKKLSL
ncbi:hypothetical protein KBI23_11790 [bacterium]|nr:hypothetical protein [bacterium]MBP9806894.1 hypothetical protein [bacterium]